MANLELLDPFAQDYPETLVTQLSFGHACCLRFNRTGSHLAAGLLDGSVVIWDFLTHGPVRTLKGHTRPINSVSWSRCGRYVLSAARDWKLVLWDLQDGSRLHTVRFEAPIWGADMHPSNHLICVAALFEDKPCLVDMSSGEVVKHVLPTVPLRSQEDIEGMTEKQVASDASQQTLVTIWDKSGSYILSGTSKGWINIIAYPSLDIVKSIRIGNTNIKHMRLSPSGRELVLNPADRIIRTIQLPDLATVTVEAEIEIEYKFQDVINRLQWNAAAFSQSGDYVLAASHKRTEIYIWERASGTPLVKILEGTREELVDMDWHPVQPLVVAAGLEQGVIYVWAIPQAENWSALAPDFVELEENVEYEEREDEFDIVDDEELNKRKAVNEDEDVDITTIDQRELDQEGFRIPVILEKDEELIQVEHVQSPVQPRTVKPSTKEVNGGLKRKR
ncbi:Set1 complex component swd1 [Saitoella complicata NRRL Y-17804]|uniref:Set1 complex component swd1 n=1 Tax=Saitoella complicata (strain BCRC 22490 / CBS 7301 / JCM 7358 / NBRC 10748 / NRRL Y-17804) TaxID=698492 RepID=UPI000866B458|nr:Set1 complex component swd1 [Saitoella complicata NRRL Y-17804]ODQ55874.1 Set1 complex component swd1 [Saitoella complicata NRRL Y-17804]